MSRQFNFTKFCEDNSISYVAEGHKHCRPGWIQIECPFCTGNPGYHLGFEIEKNRFHCWRCGAKRINETISKLLNTDISRAVHICRQYEGRSISRHKKIKGQASVVKLPDGCTSLNKYHKQYLKSRQFDWKKIVRDWKIMGTGPYGEYKHRIIVPIYYRNQLVTYQGRDITDKAKAKYKACHASDEIRNIKSCLYGYDKAMLKGSSVVVVEGVFDVWRLGAGAVCTFGIIVSMAQVNMLRMFDNINIYFDSGEVQAREQADKLAHALSVFGKEVYTIEHPDVDDPANLPQDKADDLMKEICNGK